MDHILVKESHEVVIDIESCMMMMNKEVGSFGLSNDKVENTVSITVCSPPMDSASEKSMSLFGNSKSVGEISPISGKNSKKEKRKPMSAKRPPKPPRPPKRFSLDAADQKLLKEISELAMIKRTRIERMKALKKMKAAKASSSANFIAMLFTLLFCIVILLQGCHSSGTSPTNSPDIDISGSLESRGAAEGNIIVVRDQLNLSAFPMELIPSSDDKYEDKKSVG